jgi:uncharacterized membrane protein YqhA
MNSWVIVLIIFVAFSIVISHLNTFRKNAKQKLRKTALNDLKETLPRSNRDSTDKKKP